MNKTDAIALATKMATRSPQGRFKTGCVIIGKKGEILSKGWSHLSEARMAEYFSVHAELHALLRTAYRPSLEGGIAYIVTKSGKSGDLTMARPCRACAAALYAAGIKKIVFTWWDGSVKEVDLDKAEQPTFKLYPRGNEKSYSSAGTCAA